MIVFNTTAKEVKSNGIDPSKFHTKSQTIQLTYKSSHYDEDEEYIATNIKHNKSQPMRPRRSPRTRNKKDDVIDLLSSDDETSISYMVGQRNSTYWILLKYIFITIFIYFLNRPMKIMI